MTPPVKTFRLYPEAGDKRWYRVRIFRTKALMYAYHDQRHRQRRIEYAPGRNAATGHDYEALTTGWETFRSQRGQEIPTNDVGEILFHEGYLGAGVVSHEMTHAALYWLDHLGYTPQDLSDPAIEERFAHVAGELNRKFCRKYLTGPTT